MGQKKLENIFTNLKSKNNYKKNKKLEKLEKKDKENEKNKLVKIDKDEQDAQNIIRLGVLVYSIYYYFAPVKIIFYDLVQNQNILTSISSLYKLFFSIDSTAKFIIYFIIYVLL